MARSRSLLDIFVGLSVRSAKFKSGLTDAEKAAQRWQKKIAKDLGGVRKSFDQVSKAAGGLAAVLVGRGVANAIGEQVRLKAAAADTARFLGIGTVEYSKFTFAAEQFGVQQNQVNLFLQRMTRNISEASAGIGEARNAFRVLNLDAAQLRNLKADEQFEAIADALSKIENRGDRIAVARKIFDSEGAAAALRMAEGFSTAADQAERLGVTLSEKAAQRALEARSAFAQMDSVMDQMKENITLSVTPAIISIANALLGVKVQFDLLTSQQQNERIEQTRKRLAGAQKDLKDLLERQQARKTERGGGFLGTDVTAGVTPSQIAAAEQAVADLTEELDDYLKVRDKLANAGQNGIAVDLEDLAPGSSSRSSRSARDRGVEAAKVIEQVRLQYASEAERLHSKIKADIARVQQAAIEGLGLTPDAANARLKPVIDAILRGYEEDLAALTETAKESEKKISDFSRRARENIQDIFAQGFEDAFGGGLKRMGASFARWLKRLIAQAAAAQLTNALFGGSQSGGGGGGGFLSGLFGAVFGQSHATNAFAGKAYRVEPGRPEGETFVPGMDGRFMLDSQIFGGGEMSLALNVGGSTVHVHGGGNEEQVDIFRQELAASEARQRRALDAQGRQILLKVRDERKRRRL